MQTIVSDISRVSLLRKRLGRAAFSMKVIGLLSAMPVLVYGSDHVHFLAALPLAILVLWFAFRIAGRLKAGETSAARLVAFWVAAYLAWALFDALPKALKHDIDFSAIAGLAIFFLPIYSVTRGLLELHAYKSVLKSHPGEFEPLALHPWEGSGTGVRKHPKFLNKMSLMAYAYLLLAPLLFLLTNVISLNNPGPPPGSSPARLHAFETGQFFFGLAIWLLMIRIYRRARRHAMLPGNKLLKKDDRDAVLYLRAFLDDRAVKMRARSTDGRIFLERFVKISFEELVTDHLWRYGPVVAIGNPRTRDELVPLGAARDFEPDDAWQQKATDLMRRASIIVAVVGRTEGFLWEVNTIARLGLKAKLILLLPPVKTREITMRWNSLALHATEMNLPRNIDLARTRAVIFPEDQVIAITADSRNDWTYETALDSAAQLILARRLSASMRSDIAGT